LNCRSARTILENLAADRRGKLVANTGDATVANNGMRIIRWVVMTAWLLGAAQTPASGEQPDDALGRLVQSQGSAVVHAPELAARLHELDARQSAARADRSPGTPYVEWQSEGFHSGFDRSPNAQDTLRFGSPFNFPGHSKAGRRLQEMTREWVDAGREAARIQLSAETGLRWLDLAAAIERSAVVRGRLDRLDSALALQEARHQLGEVAGTDVAQLDLEHVRESSSLADLEGEVAVLRTRLRELCGSGCQEPRQGDLGLVVSATLTPDRGPETGAAVESAPVFLSAYGEAEADRVRSELISATAFGRPLIEAEWERLPAVEGLPAFDAWGFRLSVPLPIGGAGRHRRAAAKADGAAASARAEGVRLHVTQRTTSLLAVAEGAEGRLTALRSALADLDDVEHSLSEQFRLGAITYLVFIDGLSRLDEVRLEAISARRQLLRSRLELAALLGDAAVFPVGAPDREENP
jgi:outer membrane protein TolC